MISGLSLGAVKERAHAQSETPSHAPEGQLIELSSAQIAALDLSEALRVQISSSQNANIQKASTTGAPTKNTADATGPHSIETALQQSIAYYLTLNPDRVFHLPLAPSPRAKQTGNAADGRTDPHPGNAYTVKELIQSAARFIEILRQPAGSARQQALAREFRVFESRRDPDSQTATEHNESALFTGYYTPRVPVSAKPRKGDMPIYGPPASLIRVNPREFWPEYTGPIILGRIDREQRRLLPYYTQREILLDRTLAREKERPLYYANAGDAYQMQLQGGAFLEWAPGAQEAQTRRKQPGYFGYAADNGHRFRSPGRRFSRSRRTLRRAARDRPADFLKALARNPRFIFFERQGDGPSGGLKQPLTPGRSIAMDPGAALPGLPAFVSTQSASHTVRRFVAVQDTGNAIRGHGRLDFYWGHSSAAEHRALRFKQRGRLLLFVRSKAPR